MIVCIEGCIGVGKTSLTKKLSGELDGHGIYEEFENNPFLKDFYNNPDLFAFHVQTTFLCLQSKQFLKAAALEKEKIVFADFHPIKSKIFSDIVIKNETEYVIIQKIYDRLFAALGEKVLIVYLKGSPKGVLKKIKKRNDVFTAEIPRNYIENIINTYNLYFDQYDYPLITIDTDELDFVQNNDDWLFVKKQITDRLNEMDL